VCVGLSCVNSSLLFACRFLLCVCRSLLCIYWSLLWCGVRQVRIIVGLSCVCNSRLRVYRVFVCDRLGGGGMGIVRCVCAGLL